MKYFTLHTFVVALCAFACLTPLPVFSQNTVASPYASKIDQTKREIAQAKIKIEELKLRQAEFRAYRDEAGIKRQDVDIKRFQNQIALKSEEMKMYTQMDTFAKQPLSTNPNVAAEQTEMRRLTSEKAQLSLQKLKATQAKNQFEVDRFAKQMSTLQLRIDATKQKIKLLELKDKSAK